MLPVFYQSIVQMLNLEAFLFSPNLNIPSTKHNKFNSHIPKKTFPNQNIVELVEALNKSNSSCQNVYKNAVLIQITDASLLGLLTRRRPRAMPWKVPRMWHTAHGTLPWVSTCLHLPQVLFIEMRLRLVK